MSEPQEKIIHCCACSRYIKLPEGAAEGDVVACPFCGTRNRLVVMSVYVGEKVEEA